MKAPDIEDLYRLSPLQEGIIFHHLLAQEGDPYLQTGLMAFEDRAHLDRSLAAVQQVMEVGSSASGRSLTAEHRAPGVVPSHVYFALTRENEVHDAPSARKQPSSSRTRSSLTPTTTSPNACRPALGCSPLQSK